jgi:hypothetical protein
MTDKDFKIGDYIVYNGIDTDLIKNGEVCEIVAGKDTPYKMSFPPHTPNYPTFGNDFIINPCATQEEIEAKVLKPLISVSKNDLKPYKEV